MANSYTKIYIQVVMPVLGRQSFISPAWEEKLYKFICGMANRRGQKVIAINGVSDHIHFVYGMKPDISVSELIREIKKGMNTFINDNKFTKQRFYWQEGFGAFSYSH